MTREEFLTTAATALTEAVAVPGGGAVVVRGLTGAEWDRYEAACVEVDGDERRFKANRALLVRLGAVEPAFGDDDLAALAASGSRFINPVAAVIARLSGATKDEQRKIEGN